MGGKIGYKHISHAIRFKCINNCARTCAGSKIGKRGRKRLEILKKMHDLHKIAETFKKFVADYESGEVIMHYAMDTIGLLHKSVSRASVNIEFKASIAEITTIKIKKWVLDLIDDLKELSDGDLERMKLEAQHIGFGHLCSVIDSRFEDWKEFLVFVDMCREKVEVVG